MVYCSRKRQIRMHTCTAQVARSLVYFKACEQIVMPLKELKVPKSILPLYTWLISQQNGNVI